MNEDEVKASIRAYYGMRQDIKLFTNPVGNAYVSSSVSSDESGVYLKHPRRIEYGLHKGSSDLIGWVTINGVGRFLALEVKTATGKPTDEQLNFIDMVKKAGGIAGIVRGVMDVEILLNEAKNELVNCKHCSAAPVVVGEIHATVTTHKLGLNP